MAAHKTPTPTQPKSLFPSSSLSNPQTYLSLSLSPPKPSFPHLKSLLGLKNPTKKKFKVSNLLDEEIYEGIIINICIMKKASNYNI